MTDWNGLLILTGAVVALSVLVWLMYRRAASTDWQNFSRAKKQEWFGKKSKPENEEKK